MPMQDDEAYMAMALAEARKAYDMGEVPIGAVLVDNESGAVVSAGHNLREMELDGTAHAEMEAIRKGCKKLGRWRLSGTTLYVTIEPCAMCAGQDLKAGAVHSIFNIVNHKLLNHRMEVTDGIMADQCRQIMKDFFAMRRKQNKEKKGRNA